MPLVRSPQRNSGADRMPGSLELDEVANLVNTLRPFIHPIETVVTLARPHPFDALRRAELELFFFVLVDDGVNTANMSVRRKGRHQLRSITGENVHHSTR